MSKKRTVTKPSAKGIKSSANAYKAVLFPALWGTLALFVCIVVFSYFLTKTADPDKLLPSLCLVAIALSGVVCGASSRRVCPHKPFFSILSGLVIIGILLVASLFAGDVCETSVIYKGAVVILCPAMSFIMSSLGKKSKRRTR